MMIRILFIPVTFKNYILPLSGVSYAMYILTALPFNLLFACIFTFIGIQLRRPEDLLETRDFKKKTSAEKVNFVLTYFILLLSAGIICYIGYMTKKKLKKLEKKEKEALRRKLELQMQQKKADEENGMDISSKVILTKTEVQIRKPESGKVKLEPEQSELNVINLEELEQVNNLDDVKVNESSMTKKKF